MKSSIIVAFVCCIVAVNAEGHHEMVELDCEQFYGHDDRCQQIKAYFCDHASWRLNFFTVWMPEFISYRSQRGLGDMEIPDCIGNEFTCKNETMRVCHSGPFGCDVCFCSDHQYQDVQQLDGMWRQDYQRWSHVQQQWRQLMASSGNIHSGSGDDTDC